MLKRLFQNRRIGETDARPDDTGMLESNRPDGHFSLAQWETDFLRASTEDQDDEQAGPSRKTIQPHQRNSRLVSVYDDTPDPTELSERGSFDVAGMIGRLLPKRKSQNVTQADLEIDEIRSIPADATNPLDAQPLPRTDETRHVTGHTAQDIAQNTARNVESQPIGSGLSEDLTDIPSPAAPTPIMAPSHQSSSKPQPTQSHEPLAQSDHQDMASDRAHDGSPNRKTKRFPWPALPTLPAMPRLGLGRRLNRDMQDSDHADAEAASHMPPATPMASAAAPDYADEAGWLVAQNLGKSFRGRAVVRDVTLAVREGEAVGLLGPNGAGKTTVFYMITGLIRPDKGAIRIDGYGVTKLPMYSRARLGIGYLPQEASIFRGLSVEDNIKAVLEIVEPNKAQRKDDLERLLEEFGIAHLRKTPSIALSGGERRRCEIARALASRPAFMLLDEPFAGIDPIAVGEIQQLVQQLTARGIGVLITDHNVRETLGLIDRAYIIHSGTVLMEGSPADIVNNADVRRVYLGDQFSL